MIVILVPLALFPDMDVALQVARRYAVLPPPDHLPALRKASKITCVFCSGLRLSLVSESDGRSAWLFDPADHRGAA